MPVIATNLIQGPADLYTAPFGSAEPALTKALLIAAPAAPWVDAGGTQDGIKLNIKQEYKDLEVDQLVDIPGSRLTNREPTIETNMAEATLLNLKAALNDGVITVGATTAIDTTTYDPISSLAATQPIYTALIIDGWAPGGIYKRRVIVRKILSVEGIETEYKKDGQTMWKVTFKGFYVSTAIRPFQIIDQTNT